MATRVMGVLDPVKLVITNYPVGKSEMLVSENNPEDPESGTHKLPFSGELYIEREDFKEQAGSNFFRLTLGNEVRLKSAYIIKGESVVKDELGNILEIHCTADLDSRSGSGTEASTRKVKGTLHWVSIQHAITAEVRQYDRLFLEEAPDTHEDKNFMEFVNPDSLKIISKAYLEPFLAEAEMSGKFQFQRLGYFTLDKDSASDKLVFNKTVGLRDSWAKQKPAPAAQSNQPGKQSNQGGGQPQEQRSALNEIQKIAKKYTNLSGEKLAAARADIVKFAEEVSYEELAPLFQTAAKKVGTRIGAMITLGVLLNKGQERNSQIEIFIATGLTDENEQLVEEAKALGSHQ
jgi:glutaminyl-tRNA synthetase